MTTRLTIVCRNALMAAAVAAAAAVHGTTTPSFADASDWAVTNGDGKLDIAVGREFLGRKCLYLGGSSKKCDTWFGAVSRQMPVESGATYLVTLLAYSDKPITSTTYAVRDAIECKWANAVFWHDAEGRQISSGPFAFYVPGGKKFEKVSARVKAPDGAAKMSIKLAFDRPNIGPGEIVAFSDLAVSRIDGATDGAAESENCDFKGCGRFRDDRPPRVCVVSETPTTNRAVRLELLIADDSGVDAKSARIAIDGNDSTDAFKRESDRWRMAAAPQGGWGDGLHGVTVEVSDALGNSVKARKAFFVGEVPDNAPRCELREDGMAIVDGKPFFPIGIYAVCKREFNGHDLDRAFSGLADAGFNLAHTYGKEEAKSEEFLSAAARHGFMLWHGCRFPDDWFVNRGRFCKNILAWYLGDDTCEHITPEEERDYNDAVKAIDPNRLTCQADNITPDSAISQYSPYVTATDVFMPEIYAVRGNAGDPSDRYCVAMTIRMMEQVRRDVARFGDGKPRACWPILQWFRGWSEWHHFPTRDQLFATSFAAIVHGANGILWYTYGGFFQKEKNRLNEGITSTPERWRDITELASLIREISPALLEEGGTHPEVEMLSGPATDPFGGASVTSLLKRHGGSMYLIAVNAAPEAVHARFRLGNAGAADGEVLREGRRVTCRSGALEDDFKPFGVHIYKFSSIEKTLPPLPEGAFTFAVIPDTQSYDGEGRHTKRGRAPGKGPTRNPKLDATVDWLLANAQKENILFVTHTGDIVDMNNDFQWRFASNAMSRLDGKLPYSVVPGNHDMKEDGDTSLFRRYFPASRYAGNDWYAGTFGGFTNSIGLFVSGDNANSICLFGQGAEKFAVVNLECNAPDKVLDWAAKELGRFPDRHVIVATHQDLGAIEYKNARKISRDTEGLSKEEFARYTPDLSILGRMKWCKCHGKDGNSGKKIWEKFTSRLKNAFLVVSGDQGMIKITRVDEKGVHGNMVYSLMQDTGGGFIRLFRFIPSEKVIRCYTVNPGKGGEIVHSCGVWRDDKWFNFTLPYPGTADAYIPPTAENEEPCDAVPADDPIAMRRLKWDGVENVRDLGGLPGLGGRRVRLGRVYRSAGLNDNAHYRDKNKKVLPTSEWRGPGRTRIKPKAARHVVETLGVRTDLDLRTAGEVFGMKGSPLGEKVRWVNVSSSEYSGLASDKGRAAFAEDFRVFLDESNYPILFHCIAGADRTGSLACVLNGLLGVDEELLHRDWQYTWTGRKNPVKAPEKRWNSLMSVFEAHEGTTLNERIEKFVISCGFTPEDVATFRNLMLE